MYRRMEGILGQETTSENKNLKSKRAVKNALLGLCCCPSYLCVHPPNPLPSPSHPLSPSTLCGLSKRISSSEGWLKWVKGVKRFKIPLIK